jgi:hypothetical protein
MVAERHGVGPGLEEFVVDLLGDAEPTGRVLAVDDNAVEVPALAQARQAVQHRLAAGPPDDVAEKQEAH